MTNSVRQTLLHLRGCLNHMNQIPWFARTKELVEARINIQKEYDRVMKENLGSSTLLELESICEEV